ncbi:hypothetical protein H206_05430 [Candidatus Electrothrix aarhusensis]|uniref:Uncharacterized protein n=1 Tax=Candidatus Electrothrix aarhusensis TaxID=1859131 RepID=A0A3S3UBG8_9BACT|nr:hypothetical protein H206_05430 [Candidatus Electrothrix aarhusensis]
MLIIADSSALVALALCDGLELLSRLFAEIRVPQAYITKSSWRVNLLRRCYRIIWKAKWCLFLWKI